MGKKTVAPGTPAPYVAKLVPFKVGGSRVDDTYLIVPIDFGLEIGGGPMPGGPPDVIWPGPGGELPPYPDNTLPGEFPGGGGGGGPGVPPGGLPEGTKMVAVKLSEEQPAVPEGLPPDSKMLDVKWGEGQNGKAWSLPYAAPVK